MFYYLLVYFPLVFKKGYKSSSKYTATVIVCARNEEKSIRKCLESIVRQKGAFELLLIDDGSIDKTSEIMKEFAFDYSFTEYQRLEIDKTKFPGKKKALQTGVELAKGEIIIVTDADCVASTDEWINTLLNCFDQETDLVIGYGPYNRKNGVFNSIARYECLYTAIKYLGIANFGLPYMGVGRNMAYKKEAFMNNNGFESHLHIASGDDDLFVRDIASRDNTKVLLDPKANMYSDAAPNFKEFIRQKKRHLSVGFEYSYLLKFILGLELFSVFSLYIGIIALVILNKLTFLVICLLLCKLLIHSVVFALIARKLRDTVNLFTISILDILHLISYFYISVKLLINKNIIWR